MQDINLFLFTYNCCKKGVDTATFKQSLLKVLPSDIFSLYVFGVEEFCPILDGCFPSESNRRFLKLNNVLSEMLNSKYGQGNTMFHSIGMVHMGAIGIIAIAPYPLQFSKVRTSTSGCGYFSSSLKGGAGLRLTFKPFLSEKSTELTFANVHLPAYEGDYYYQRRNNDALKLMRSLDFTDGYSLVKPGSHTFFMGDLNYRTTKQYDMNDISSKILSKLHEPISDSNFINKLVQKYDELHNGMKNNDIFIGFSEGSINFRPTYKFYIGTEIYNTKRSPSWCDRILYQNTYKDKTNDSVNSQKLPKINDYASIRDVLSSDHHPVYLSITVPFDAPESIISSSGYLKVLPNNLPVHSFDPDTGFISGLTAIYIKPLVFDKLRMYITPLSDLIIGYILWLITTPRGKLFILASTLAILFMWQQIF